MRVGQVRMMNVMTSMVRRYNNWSYIAWWHRACNGMQWVAWMIMIDDCGLAYDHRGRWRS